MLKFISAVFVGLSCKLAKVSEIYEWITNNTIQITICLTSTYIRILNTFFTHILLDFCTHIDTTLYYIFDLNYIFYYQSYIYNTIEYVLLFFIHLSVIIFKTYKIILCFILERHTLFEKSLKVIQLPFHISILTKMRSNISLDYIHQDVIRVGLVMHSWSFKAAYYLQPRSSTMLANDPVKLKYCLNIILYCAFSLNNYKYLQYH